MKNVSENLIRWDIIEEGEYVPILAGKLAMIVLRVLLNSLSNSLIDGIITVTSFGVNFGFGTVR